MPFATASDLIDYASSLADLQNTKLISYSDKLNALNEAWRDLYSRYTEGVGDFWLTETIISLIGSYADPNDPYGWLVPLPSDFYKLRYLSANQGIPWTPVQVFPISGRDFSNGSPRYRIKNSVLWLKGNNISQLKMGYHPPPAVLSAPDAPIAIASAEPLSNLELIGSSFYDAPDAVYFYILNGKTIKAQNRNTGITSTLYVSANNVDCLTYYGGRVYFRDVTAKLIYRATTDFASTIVPAALAPASVENFTILNGQIYWSTTTTTSRSQLNGTLIGVVIASFTNAYLFIGSTPGYLNNSGFIIFGGVASAFSGTQIVTDGTYILALDSSLNLSRYSVNLTTFALTLVEVVKAGVSVIGTSVSLTYLPVITDSANALSVTYNSPLTFPADEVNEIIAYSAAISFVRKQTDQSKLPMLMGRLYGTNDDKTDGLWTRFMMVKNRDEYQPQRINNDYPASGNRGR